MDTIGLDDFDDLLEELPTAGKGHNSLSTGTTVLGFSL